MKSKIIMTLVDFMRRAKKNREEWAGSDAPAFVVATLRDSANLVRATAAI
jgi:hypothetical protein